MLALAPFTQLQRCVRALLALKSCRQLLHTGNPKPLFHSQNFSRHSGTACMHCKARKQACDQGLKVCKQCVCFGKGLECVYSSLHEDVCGQHILETLAVASKEESHAWETRKAKDPTWDSDYKDWIMLQT
eukprot:2346644-Rhodomonas_salina.1